MSFNKLVLSFPGDSFIEPESGAMLHRDKWYLMGSGLRHMYSHKGFATRGEAQLVVRGMACTEPSYLPAIDTDGRIDHEAAGSWDMALTGLLLVLGRDVWHWWATNHPERLATANRELVRHYV